MFKIKDRYKLQLQTPKTMKSFDNTPKLIDKQKTEKSVPRFRVAELVLVQYDLVNNQYQQKSEI